MPVLSSPVNIDRLRPAGPPRTTGAGRFAIPVDLMDGERKLLTLDLVFDESGSEQLHDALDGHLAGERAGTPTECATRSKADLQ